LNSNLIIVVFRFDLLRLIRFDLKFELGLDQI